MKEIKLKPKTIHRINQIESNIKMLNEQKNNVFLTILELNEIDLDKFTVDYNEGIIVLTENKK